MRQFGTMLSASTTEMLLTYHELNGATDELQDPSPLIFMRFVAKNRPFVVRGGCSTWQARRKWGAKYLRLMMKDTPVNVAVTPYGSVSYYASLGKLTSD